MAHVFTSVGVDGVIATNTSIDHSVLGDQDKGCVGGLSGAPLFPLALHVFQRFRDALPEDMPMIASGGVMSRSHIEAYLTSGAALVQVYTGLIYGGPTFWVP